MTNFATISQICFLACHPASTPFVQEAQSWCNNNSIQSEVYARDTAYERLQGKVQELKSFAQSYSTETLDKLGDRVLHEAAVEVAYSISKKFQAVICDVGSPFTSRVFEILSEKSPEIVRISFYDNPERYVPGGYSETAKKTLEKSHLILFANKNLSEGQILSTPNTEIELDTIERAGIGFSTLPQQIKTIKEGREEEKRTLLRKEILDQHNIEDKGQKIAVYYGGANSEYYEKAFPAFLTIIEGLSNESNSKAFEYVFIIQQHPRAKSEGIDAKKVEEMLMKYSSENEGKKIPHIVISQTDFNSATKVADLALYYQTGSNTLFPACGIPTVQVGHETFKDILTSNEYIPSATSASEFVKALKTTEEKGVTVTEEEIFTAQGISKNPQSEFVKAINNANRIRDELIEKTEE